MNKIEYVGKCLFIEQNEEKILVVGDMHIGYGNSNEAMGAMINKKIYDSIIEDFDKIFLKIGKVDKVILLGDVKHGFSPMNEEERYGIINIVDYLRKKCGEIIIIKGNHDNYLVNLTSKMKVKVLDYCVFGEFCFLHGDKDFAEIYDKRIKCWMMGHLHPVIKLQDRGKTERYKCFLEGKFKDKKVIIVPSFVEYGGVDVRELDKEGPWKFKYGDFEVFITGENLEVLNFGKLKNIN